MCACFVCVVSSEKIWMCYSANCIFRHVCQMRVLRCNRLLCSIRQINLHVRRRRSKKWKDTRSCDQPSMSRVYHSISIRIWGNMNHIFREPFPVPAWHIQKHTHILECLVSVSVYELAHIELSPFRKLFLVIQKSLILLAADIVSHRWKSYNQNTDMIESRPV